MLHSQSDGITLSSIYRTTVGLSILALRMSTSESSQMKDFFLKHAVSCHEMPSPYLKRVSKNILKCVFHKRLLENQASNQMEARYSRNLLVTDMNFRAVVVSYSTQRSLSNFKILTNYCLWRDRPPLLRDSDSACTPRCPVAAQVELKVSTKLRD